MNFPLQFYGNPDGWGVFELGNLVGRGGLKQFWKFRWKVGGGSKIRAFCRGLCGFFLE